MKLQDKIILVTGGANGIGKGLCERFAREGARKIIVTDIDLENAAAVAQSIDGLAFRLDVSREEEVKTVAAEVMELFGRIDIVVSNAGIGGEEGCLEVSNDAWQKIYDINVLSHVYLGRAVFPQMLARGEGYFVITASAAGLLTYPTAAPYSVTKHAAVALAEYLNYTYRDQGIRVSCLCPQGVKTRLISSKEGEPDNFLMAEAITVEDCAEAVVKGMESEKFLILPHAEVGEYIVNKAQNYDRWLAWMSQFRTKILGEREK